MSLGTPTLSAQLKKSASAPLDVFSITFAGDSSYPTGGTASFNAYVQALLKREVKVAAVLKAASTGVYTPIYDLANDTLYVEDKDGVEVTNATNLSATTFKLTILAY
jgi:hypothetical protein